MSITTEKVRTVRSDISGEEISDSAHVKVYFRQNGRSWVLDASDSELNEMNLLNRARETTGQGRPKNSNNS